MKVCTKCQIPQPLENFSNNKNKKDGKNCQCKLCYKQYREENKEELTLKTKQYRNGVHRQKLLLKKKQYREENKEKILLKKKQYREENKETVTLKVKQWHEENRERVYLRTKQWYEKNKEIISLKRKQWREKNKEETSLKYKQWRQTSIGRVAIKNGHHKRRTITKQGDVTNEQLTELLNNSTHCFYCKNPLILNEIHIDHYIPLFKGGLHTVSNLRVACKKCNLQKGHKMPEEFITPKNHKEEERTEI